MATHPNTTIELIKGLSLATSLPAPATLFFISIALITIEIKKQRLKRNVILERSRND